MANGLTMHAGIGFFEIIIRLRHTRQAKRSSTRQNSAINPKPKTEWTKRLQYVSTYLSLVTSTQTTYSD